MMNRIALLIPHFNNPEGLLVSLASVGLEEAVDVFIVDDGSHTSFIDEANCRLAYQARGKLEFVYIREHQGIEHALNAGLLLITKAGYEYVARLDCGDKNKSDRCAQQAAFLDANPSIALVGSAVTFFDETGDRFTLQQPLIHRDIVYQMHDDNAFTHPTVMFRVAAIREIGFYPTHYPKAEDFAYFWRFASNYTVANLAEVLVKTEYKVNGISFSGRSIQQRTRLRLLWEYFDWTPRSCMLLVKPMMGQIIPFAWIQRIKRFLKVQSWS